MNNNKIKWIVTGIAASLFLVGVWFAITVALWVPELEPVATPRPEAPISDLSTQREFEESFLEGCNGEVDGIEVYCQCAWDYLERNYGYNRIMEITVDYVTTGDIPAELTKADEYCAK